jgi:hypothetical protein
MADGGGGAAGGGSSGGGCRLPAAQVGEPAAWRDLPDEALAAVFRGLRCHADLVAAGATCSQWRRVHSGAWRGLALQRWHAWPGSQPGMAADAAWRAEYVRRHQLDAAAAAHLAAACWPLQRAQHMAALAELGWEASEYLAAAAVTPGEAGGSVNQLVRSSWRGRIRAGRQPMQAEGGGAGLRRTHAQRLLGAPGQRQRGPPRPPPNRAPHLPPPCRG